ncbi:MAG: polysaccharide pyruvyl transferase family protein [Alphaproteobacteria bacterium]|nr:polysaccharide pyruvyl transferase family protein [Rhizobium sp.]MBU3961917.1 polysaccharide pyruvyl transferase family protein [Alphaproteobacteria bacterium]MBU4049160.1 polysaccharide pyruvyl transferase family protein [Alphaproteobacteria bacterium]MBU4091331.1 polysaccharide pyruvyl transferase family protein [Alphaproteobacteria bacterium]MBU4156838.1 polysaccharide pyruvyl transferase family protein [Alphaproteobacteria bacterium]
MKIGALSWNGNNIGDDIQSVAVMQHLPPVDVFLNRDHLNSYDGPETLLVTNGWFLSKLDNWPPSPSIKPIFFGFHVQKHAKPTIARHVDYLKKHQPIGCRDQGTVDFIRSLGVEAYLSLCNTLTFNAPADRDPDSIYLVEANRDQLSPKLFKKGLTVKTVSHRFIDVSAETRLQYAKEIVETYGKKAALVVTTRIHCAMPCIAMGVPVIFVGPKSYRTQIVEEVGLQRHNTWHPLKHPFTRRIEAWPQPLDIAETKKRVTADIKSRIAAALAKA